MIVIDTNVVSELMRREPDVSVVRWFRDQDDAEMVLTAISEGELRLGAAVLPDGRRKSDIIARIDKMVVHHFGKQVLAFDSEAAEVYAVVVASRRASGRPIAMADAQIASIAFVHDAAVATRDVRDFEDCGIALINPWEPRAG